MEWALVNGLRAKAEKSGTVGICPGCGGDVRAKCGEVVSWHWAHINADCDPWSEPETEWHRRWKGFFPADWQEVIKPPHRADVAGPDGVLEIQRSGISPAEIREREQFYGRMAWLLNGHDFWEHLEWIKAAGDYHEFRWKHARKTWITASRTIFIDTPLGLFRVKNIRDGRWKVICGWFIEAAKLMHSLESSGKTNASMDLLLYDSFTENTRNAFFAKANELDTKYSVYAFLCEKLNGYVELPRWRDFHTAHQYLRMVNSEQATALRDYYTNQIQWMKQRNEENEKERQRILLEQEKRMREKNAKRAGILAQMAEDREVQQAINRAANAEIAAAMFARGTKA